MPPEDRNTQELKGRVVVITGASSGFGKGAARKLAEKGAAVVLAARRDEALDDLVRECEQLGGSAVSIATDVSEEREVESFGDSAFSRFGKIDAWISNAGTGAVGPFLDIPLKDHVQVVRTDLLGTLFGSYFALRRFRDQGRGTLINVASIAGKVPHPYYSSYVAAKHGVVGLSAVLRRELEMENVDTIRVCTVLPVAHDTPFFEHAANYSGREVTPPAARLRSGRVVNVLVRLVTDPEDEVEVGGAAKMMAFSHAIAPGATEKMMEKEVQKVPAEKAPPAEDGSGSLHEPVASGTGVRGGWKK